MHKDILNTFKSFEWYMHKFWYYATTLQQYRSFDTDRLKARWPKMILGAS